MQHHVYIGAGSNSKPADNLTAGVKKLADSHRIRVIAVSLVYETAAINSTDSAAYLNAALYIQTDMDPDTLKTHLRTIEDACGRIRRKPDGSKATEVALDFDILLYDDRQDDRFPHPDITRHAHVAVPLADIAAEIIHPETGQSIRTIADSLRGSSSIRKVNMSLPVP